MSLLLLLSGAGAAPVTPPVVIPSRSSGGGAYWEDREYEARPKKQKLIDVAREDEEMLEIIITSVLSGIFD